MEGGREAGASSIAIGQHRLPEASPLASPLPQGAGPGKVSTRPLAAAAAEEDVDLHTECSVTITGLAQSTEYMVRVTAISRKPARVAAGAPQAAQAAATVQAADVTVAAQEAGTRTVEPPDTLDRSPTNNNLAG